MRHFIILLTLIFIVILPTAAQGVFNEPRESGRAYVLSTANGTIQIAQMDQDFSGTIDIDYHPEDPRRWARIGNFGIIRFTDPNTPDIFEGVYTFAPYVENFQVGEPAENKVFAREVEWSPDGQMLAFRIQNEATPDLNQGVWFWQPLQEISTDPSYQILRHCPPYCTAAGTTDSDPGWRSTSLEWSSDNNSILIGLRLIGENRRAITIRQALRDRDQTQAITRPTPLLFDYGYWANDGQRIVVSGTAPDNSIVFGTIDRTASVSFLVPAQEIGMAWVQNAVQAPDDSLIMLGSTVGFGSPLQIVNQDGEQLTPPIGESAPEIVKWSPDRSAVLLQTADRTYVASVAGTVYDITALLANNSPNIEWINSTIPGGFTALTLPPPASEGEFEPEAIQEAENTLPESGVIYAVGDLLVVNEGTLDIYADPVAEEVVGTLSTGDELIITSSPLRDGDVTWYRIQSLNYTGWIQDIENLGIAN